MDDGRDQPATLPVRIISANCPSACSMTTWGDARIGAGASAADDRQGEAFSRQGEVSSGLDSSAWHWDDCKTSPSSARSGLGVAGLAVVFPAAVSATAGWLTVNRCSTIGDGCALPFSVAFNRVKRHRIRLRQKPAPFSPALSALCGLGTSDPVQSRPPQTKQSRPQRVGRFDERLLDTTSPLGYPAHRSLYPTANGLPAPDPAQHAATWRLHRIVRVFWTVPHGPHEEGECARAAPRRQPQRMGARQPVQRNATASPFLAPAESPDGFLSAQSLLCTLRSPQPQRQSTHRWARGYPTQKSIPALSNAASSGWREIHGIMRRAIGSASNVPGRSFAR